MVGRAIKLRLRQLLGCFISYPPSCKTHWFFTRKRQSYGYRKGFEAVCREQALMKATKTKENFNKKLKIVEAALI